MQQEDKLNQIIKITKEETDSDNCDSEISTAELTFPQSKIQVRKVIVKLKKTKSKQYKKRELYFTPVLPPQYNFNHKFLIYGYIQIETFYKDYTSKWDCDLINMSSSMLKMRQIERNFKDNYLKISLENTGNSGLRDFQFLIDHFSKFSDQSYHYLHKLLQDYQITAREIQEHICDINRKVKTRIISEEEITKAQQDFEEYFQNHINLKQKESEFITYGMIQLDHETLDIEQKYACISLATLSLLGIEIDDIEHKLLHSTLSFTQLLGLDRIQNTIRQLNTYSNDLTTISYQQDIITADSLTFSSNTTIEIVTWPDRPSWMSKYYLVGLVSKQDVSLNQIKAILELRANQTQEQFYMFTHHTEDLFEYTIQSEIFLEKFYPELYTNPQSKKTMVLKKQKNQSITTE